MEDGNNKNEVFVEAREAVKLRMLEEVRAHYGDNDLEGLKPVPKGAAVTPRGVRRVASAAVGSDSAKKKAKRSSKETP